MTIKALKSLLASVGHNVSGKSTKSELVTRLLSPLPVGVVRNEEVAAAPRRVIMEHHPAAPLSVHEEAILDEVTACDTPSAVIYKSSKLMYVDEVTRLHIGCLLDEAQPLPRGQLTDEVSLIMIIKKDYPK